MYNDIVKKIKEFDNIVVARHVGVDPDALCSQLALRDSIKLTYPDKKVIAVGTGSAKFIPLGKLDKYEKLDNALLIVCDTPDKKRVDIDEIDTFQAYIKIDHHPFIETFCDIELIDDTKSSASEIIMDMIDKTELKCNSEIFETLYMGLVSDSNRFLFNSCNSDTFSLVSKYMKEYPIDIASAYLKLYLRPLNEVRLEGYIALNMTVTENGLAYIIITNDILEEFKVDSASAGNLINNFNFIKESLVWITVTEDVKNANYRMSIRSRGPIVNKLAEKYNGGGHKFASGIRIKTLDEVSNIIADFNGLLKDYNLELKEGNSDDN